MVNDVVGKDGCFFFQRDFVHGVRRLFANGGVDTDAAFICFHKRELVERMGKIFRRDQVSVFFNEGCISERMTAVYRLLSCYSISNADARVFYRSPEKYAHPLQASGYNGGAVITLLNLHPQGIF